MAINFEYLKKMNDKYTKTKRNEPQYEYTIIGDVEKYEGCLVYACGSDYENAKKLLDRLKFNPTDEEVERFTGYKNLRIERVEQKDCWWGDLIDVYK